jgi:hypothetical protein
MKPLKKEDVDLWFRVNNLIVEKVELYYDFCETLHLIVRNTYLGDSSDNETKISMGSEDIKNHFDWCWKKTIQDFKKENIFFKEEGEHYDYFYKFFYEMFYEQNKKQIKDTISEFLENVFDIDKIFSKSDLDILTSTYKILDRNMFTNENT